MRRLSKRHPVRNAKVEGFGQLGTPGSSRKSRAVVNRPPGWERCDSHEQRKGEPDGGMSRSDRNRREFRSCK